MRFWRTLMAVPAIARQTLHNMTKKITDLGVLLMIFFPVCLGKNGSAGSGSTVASGGPGVRDVRAFVSLSVLCGGRCMLPAPRRKPRLEHVQLALWKPAPER